jgi:hypothetical protein
LREEEVQAAEMPTGGGDDENGNLDFRMEEAMMKAEASKQKQTDLLKRKFGSNYGSTMEIVQYWISLFPLVIAGVGIMSERAMQSGAGRKRESSLESELSTDSSDASEGRTTKKQVMASLSLKMEKQHQESMKYIKEYNDTQRSDLKTRPGKSTCVISRSRPPRINIHELFTVITN